MSDQRLRDLLHDRVSVLDPDDLGDLGGPAWARARRTRHRRAAAVGGGAVAAVLAATALAVLPGDGESPAPPAQRPSTSSAPTPAGATPKAVGAGSQHGAQVWWAPARADEADLPPLAVAALPEEVDLSAGAPAHPPGVPAAAVFMVGSGDGADLAGRVVVLGTDGATYDLDAGRLDRVADEQGNVMVPLSEEGLSPDGRRVLFRQEGSLEVYDLMTGRWATVDTPDWVAETARWASSTEIWVPDLLGAEAGPGTTYDASGRAVGTTSLPGAAVWSDGGGTAYGPVRAAPGGEQLSGLEPRRAQARFPGVELAGPSGGLVGGAEVVAVSGGSGDRVDVLVVTDSRADRWKTCCPVVGWLDPETLLLASRGNESRVLAWRVGTPDLYRVTELTGWVPGQDFHVASYADAAAR